MEEKINQALGEEVLRQIKGLKDLETGTREMGSAVDDVIKLHKQLVETEKAGTEARKLDIEESKSKSDSEIEQQNCKDALAEQKKDRWVKLGITIAEISIPLVFSGILFAKGMRFEETGSYTAKTPQVVGTFQGIANKMRRIK